ncbi:MAG: hypothetical protein AB1589_19005 [Cyanobacteriota bacterium]
MVSKPLARRDKREQMIEDAPSEMWSLQLEAGNEQTSSDRLTELAGISTDLARRVALNSNAPPKLLQELSQSYDTIIRQNVTANPNTPREVLLDLCAEFPEQLLGNPVFFLLFLENPNLIDEIPLATLKRLLMQETVPVSFLEWGVNKLDQEAQLTLAMNARTPKTVLEKMLCSQYNLVVEVTQLHLGWIAQQTSTIKSSTFLGKIAQFIATHLSRKLFPSSQKAAHPLINLLPYLSCLSEKYELLLEEVEQTKKQDIQPLSYSIQTLTPQEMELEVRIEQQQAWCEEFDGIRTQTKELLGELARELQELQEAWRQLLGVVNLLFSSSEQLNSSTRLDKQQFDLIQDLLHQTFEINKKQQKLIHQYWLNLENINIYYQIINTPKPGKN